MLLVEVHQLHLVVGDLLLVGRLEHEGDIIGLILGLDGDDVIIGSTPRNKKIKFFFARRDSCNGTLT